MKLTKQQIIYSFSFVIVLLGLAFAFFSISKGPNNYNTKQKIIYLNNTNAKDRRKTQQKEKNDNISFLSLASKLAGFNKGMNYLVLFQNNLEIRPTGGFVSSFATIKVKNAHPEEFHFYDTAVFDTKSSVPTNIKPPEALKKYLWIKNWQFRDGNWSPDFPTSAQKMIELYHLQGGQEKFDGVIAITPEVLKSLLKIYGPIEMPNYGLTISADNFLLTLEQQVEIDFKDQGISRINRKNIIKDLAQILIQKLLESNPLKSINLISLVKNHLDTKDILLFLNDQTLQKDIEKANWSGKIKQTSSDYIFIVDSNVNAFKADYFVSRNFEYTIDLTKSPALAKLVIHYQHSAQKKSWLVRDYTNWLRVYVPQNSWFINIKGLETKPEYGKKYEKTFMAGLIKMPINSSKDVVLEYNLPENFATDSYKLYIQKQPGIGVLPIKLLIIYPDGKEYTIEKTIQTDEVI